MIRPVVLLLTATAISAADVLVMRDGLEISGTIMRRDSKEVVLDIGGGLIATFESARIASITRRDSLPEQRIGMEHPVKRMEPTRTARIGVQTPTQRLSLAAGVSAGWIMGDITGSGTLSDLGASTVVPLESRFELDGLGAMPGAWIRFLHDNGETEASPVLGMQISYGGTGGDEAFLDQATICLVGGWAIPAGECRFSLLADAGPAMAEAGRTLLLPNAELVESRTDLTGWTVGLTVDCTWSTTWGVEIILDVGVHRSSLSGESKWATANYAGEEELRSRQTALAAGIAIAWRM